MIIGTRFGDAQQLHRVRSPGGDRTQLTFFPDPVSGASYQPTEGRYIVFTKDVGGAEFFQKYRYDVATGEITLLTDGKSRNVGGAWSHKGDRYAYMSTRRNGREDRKSTRLNSSHGYISYAVFCLKKKKKNHQLHEATHTSRYNHR